MNGEICDAIENGILTPASKLRVKEEEEEDFNQGVIIERSAEILTKGHQVSLSVNARVENVKLRSNYSNYVIEPNKFKFEKVVRILATVWKFIRSFKVIKSRNVNKEVKFQMLVNVKTENGSTSASTINSITPIITSYGDEKYLQNNFMSGKNSPQAEIHCQVFDENYLLSVSSNVPCEEKVVDAHRIAALEFGTKVTGRQFKGKYHILLTDLDVSLALEYLFKKGSEEVRKFNKPDLVKKLCVEKDGILMSRSRILDCIRFQVAGGLENLESLFQFGIKSMNPVLDRYSPLSYSIGDYIHRIKANHRGYENCYRESLAHVFIIQGMSLFRELNEDCVKCIKMRGQYIQAAMGPVSDAQLTIAPAFWICMADIMGPVHIYAPGHAARTRNTKAIEVKAYVMVFVCPTTKNVNIQVLEGKSADAIVDGLNRLGCEVGFPSYFLIDKDSGIMKALNDANVSLKDMQGIVYKERKIKFKTCPIGGHNFHGAVERRIRCIEENMEKAGIFKLKIHATGLQTVLKLIENQMNNLPLGYMFGRDSDNSPLLKMICPNFLRVGRINDRSLDGPITLPSGPGEMMEKVEKAYVAFFRIWNEVMVPKLMKLNKWFDSKGMLAVGDVVYFQKIEDDLASNWILGIVEEVIKSRDDVVRKVVIKYQNANENISRCTERTARKIIKLFHIDDTNWLDDMKEVESLKVALEAEDDEEKESRKVKYVMNPVRGEGLRFRLTAVSGYRDVVELKRLQNVKVNAKAKVARMKFIKPCQYCCCFGHCSIECKNGDVLPDGWCINPKLNANAVRTLPSQWLDRSWLSAEQYEEEILSLSTLDKNLVELISSVNTDLSNLDAATLGINL